MVELYFFRHGETDWNKQELVQGGASDIPLNETGKQQAEELAKRIGSLKLDLFLSSDMIRARQTVGIVNKAGLPVHYDPRLREVLYGDAEGKNRWKMREKYQDVTNMMFNPLHPDTDKVRVPGGESRHEIIDRITSVFFDHLNQDHTALKIGVSSHNGVMFNLMTSLVRHNYEFKHCEIFPVGYDRKQSSFIRPNVLFDGNQKITGFDI
jgi:broad specificity phosphatase PhoE